MRAFLLPGGRPAARRALGVAALLAWCSACPPATPTAQPCNATRDCPDDQLCREGLCQPRPAASDAAVGDRSAPDLAGPVDRGPIDRASGADRGVGDAVLLDASATDGARVDGAPLDATARDAAAVDLVSPADGGACARAACPWYTTCVEVTDGGALCLCNWTRCEDGEVCLLPEGDGSGIPRCCAQGLRNCDGTCLDLQASPEHCGACDRRCAWGESCVDGACRCGGASCAPATQDCCDGICRDVLGDDLHCGPVGTGLGCAASCSGGSACVDGRCSCSGSGQCGDTGTCCDDSYCANLASDPLNCGACGLVCRPGELCQSRLCVCGPTCDDGDSCTEDTCVLGRCAHATLDGDDDGYCHPGCADAQSGDQTGECVDGDCDDGRDDVFPGGRELCDGRDSDCDPMTLDGADECPGRCCGVPASCRACCQAADCGTGGWRCTVDFACACDAPLRDCGGDCRSANACGGCAALDGVPDEPCGNCGLWACAGQDAVVCQDDHPRVRYYRDDDGDGYGLESDHLDLCAPLAPHTATRSGDCDDDCATCYPGARELCDQLINTCGLATADPPTCWWDARWRQRVLLMFDRSNRTEALQDFPLLVVLNPNRIDDEAVLSNLADLRFVDGVSREVLAFEVEQWAPGGDSFVWVKVPLIAASLDDHIWLYFDNPQAVPPTRQPTEVWSNGYRAVYHLNGSFADSTGRAGPGLPHGVAEAPGQIGPAGQFGGASWIDLGRDLLAASGMPAATLSVWVRPSALPAAGSTLVGWSVALPPSTQITRVALELDGPELRVLGRTVDATTPSHDLVVDTPNLNLGQWYFLNGVLDFAGGRIQGFINSDLRDSVVVPWSPTMTPGTPSTRAAIGAEEDGSIDFFTGLIDEVRLAQVARSHAWIRAEYDVQRDLFIGYGPIESF